MDCDGVALATRFNSGVRANDLQTTADRDPLRCVRRSRLAAASAARARVPHVHTLAEFVPSTMTMSRILNEPDTGPPIVAAELFAQRRADDAGYII